MTSASSVLVYVFKQSLVERLSTKNVLVFVFKKMFPHYSQGSLTLLHFLKHPSKETVSDEKPVVGEKEVHSYHPPRSEEFCSDH